MTLEIIMMKNIGHNYSQCQQFVTGNKLFPLQMIYQTHSVEIKIDELPIGEYILLAASDNFSKEAVIGARVFYVSNISFVNNEDDYFVLNRETGKPLASATVQVWEQRYDHKQSKYIKQKTQLYKTDAMVFLKSINHERGLFYTQLYTGY